MNFLCQWRRMMKSSWCQANLFFFFTCKFFPKSQITNKFFENEVVLEFQLPQVREKKKSPFSYNMVIRMYVAMYRHTHTHTHFWSFERWLWDHCQGIAFTSTHSSPPFFLDWVVERVWTLGPKESLTMHALWPKNPPSHKFKIWRSKCKMHWWGGGLETRESSNTI